MPSINVRNLPDELHERIARAAVRSERSLEAEVRHTLAAAYPTRSGLSLRQEWMQATAERLRHLHLQLKADDFWRLRGPATLTQLARQLGEETPARLLSWMEGSEPLTFEAARRIEALTGCSAEWLIDGAGDMFPVRDISEYRDFFLPATPGDYEFHLIRVGLSDGMAPLHVIRHDSSTGSMASGQMMGRFYLDTGMGSSGMGNLKRFLQFLKQHSLKLRLHSYEYAAATDDTGAHHPAYYLNSNRLTKNAWLERLLNGEARDGWAEEFKWLLDEVKNTPAVAGDEPHPDVNTG